MTLSEWVLAACRACSQPALSDGYKTGCQLGLLAVVASLQMPVVAGHHTAQVEIIQQRCRTQNQPNVGSNTGYR